ncbi:hypothetical protein [Streptomyces sp. SID13031]|uniref:hypothetical protein n=1 Tax=Streptomyces sp. SID13031 TaxID=2706046 RepID=UPI0013C9FB0A|nr:hypothetical protein [Streptomyces sp. SID13031]NEA35730.1 hypothetical protein [Streptomyces sp. SID13031]
MSASEWASESGKGLVDIASKGAGGGGILGLIAGIIASLIYSDQPAKAYICPQAGGIKVRVEPDALGRPPSGSILCDKVINGGPFGEWSSWNEAGLQLGFAVLLIVFVAAVWIMIAQMSPEERANM